MGSLENHVTEASPARQKPASTLPARPRHDQESVSRGRACCQQQVAATVATGCACLRKLRQSVRIVMESASFFQHTQVVRGVRHRPRVGDHVKSTFALC